MNEYSQGYQGRYRENEDYKQQGETGGRSEWREEDRQEEKNQWSGQYGPRTREEVLNVRQPGIASLTAIMGAKETLYNNEVFYGATINCLFGGIKLILDHAVIEQDISVDILCICGGVEIFVPPFLNVVVDSTPIMGGVSNKVKKRFTAGAPTLHIRATCICGGVDIK